MSSHVIFSNGSKNMENLERGKIFLEKSFSHNHHLLAVGLLVPSFTLARVFSGILLVRILHIPARLSTHHMDIQYISVPTSNTDSSVLFCYISTIAIKETQRH